MDPLIDAPSGDDRDFRPEPRDLMVVIMDYVKLKGVEIAEDHWTLNMEDGACLQHVVFDEYTDVLMECPSQGGQPNFRVDDNTFTGVIFQKGDVSDLNRIYEAVRPLIEAEGGTF